MTSCVCTITIKVWANGGTTVDSGSGDQNFGNRIGAYSNIPKGCKAAKAEAKSMLAEAALEEAEADLEEAAVMKAADRDERINALQKEGIRLDTSRRDDLKAIERKITAIREEK